MVVAAAVALGLAGWGTLQLIDVFTGDDAGSSAAGTRTTDCKPAPKPSVAAPLALKPAQVTVNVYNATPRGGLAKAAADELKLRGFAIGKVGNAPEAYDKKIPGTGILLGGAAAQRGAFRVLATQLKGSQVKTDTRATADIDLILGTAFRTLDTKKDADTALAALANPAPAPAPSGKC